MSTSYGPLLADGNQSEDGLEISQHQISSHARVSNTTANGGTYQRDLSTLNQASQNQRLEQDKGRGSLLNFNDGNNQQLDKSLFNDDAEEDDPSSESGNSSDEDIRKTMLKDLKKKTEGKLTTKIKERYLLASSRKAIRERLKNQIRQEFAYEQRIENAFNLDESAFVGSDEDQPKNKKEVKSRKQKIEPKQQAKGNQVMPMGSADPKDSQEMEPAVRAKENKKTYLRNYAIEFELPSKVIKGSKIYGKDPRYIFQVLNYLIPKPDDIEDKDEQNPKRENILSDEEVSEDGQRTDQTMVHSYYPDGTNESKSFGQQFDRYQQGACVRLLYKDGIQKGIVEIDKVMIGLETTKKVNNIIMKFSSSGKYLAVFLSDIYTLKIYDVEKDTPEQILKKLDNEKSDASIYWKFTGENEDADKQEDVVQIDQTIGDEGMDSQLKFVKRIDYGNSDKHLILFGSQEIMILDLETKMLQETFSLEKNLDLPTGVYERLLDARVAVIPQADDMEGLSKPYRCQVACKKVGQKMVDIFDIDYFENKKNGALEKLCELTYQKIPFKTELRTIIYFEDDQSSIYCKIGEDFSKVILVNRKDNYILQDDKLYDNDGETVEQPVRRSQTAPGKSKRNEKRSQHIKRLPQLAGKVTNYIYPWGNDFFLVAYHDYDQSMDIIFTDQDKFEVEFPKQIQPGIMKIYDMKLMMDKDTQECRLTVVSSRDNGFSVDQAMFRIKPKAPGQSHQSMVIDPEKGIQYSSDSQQPLQGFFTKWPYTCYQGMDDAFIVILNAYDKDNINRVRIPNIDKICSTYITETNNLYVMCQKDDKYILQYIDLDANNRSESQNKVFDNFRVTKIFQYNSSDVHDRPFNEIHIRGSSDKEVIDNNQKLTVFFLHSGCLYSWIQTNEQKRKIKAYSELGREVLKINQNKQLQQRFRNQSQQLNRQLQDQVIDYMQSEKLELVTSDVNSQQFYTIDDNNFLLLENIYGEGDNQKKVLVGQHIVQYTVDFSEVQKYVLVEETIENENIINFSVDQLKMKLVIFSRVQKLSSDQNQKLTIYDLKKKKIDYERLIKGKELCGRLESGLYTIVDGHIYYGNNCIKMRYDLIEQPNSSTYTENEIFDIYNGLFSLKDGDWIISGSPFDCMAFHKFVYVIKRPKDPSRVVITPYLHEKKIYMHRFKENTEYFQTSLISENAYVRQSTNSRGIEAEGKDMGEQLKSLISVNLSESKYYVFSMKGLLRNRIDYSKAVKKHGLPVAVSENGLNFVLYHKSNNQKQGKPECSIYHLQEHEFTYVKTIELDKCFVDYYSRLKKSSNPNRKTFGRQLEQMLEINDWINPTDEKKQQKHQNKKKHEVEHSFQINNKMDLIIKFSKANPEHQYQHLVTSQPNILLDKIIEENDVDESILPDNLMLNSLNNVSSFMTSSRKDSVKSSPPKRKASNINKVVKIHPEDGVASSVSKSVGQSIYEMYDYSESEKKNFLKYESVYYFQSGGYSIPFRRNLDISRKVQGIVHDPDHDMTKLARIEQHFVYFVDDYKQNMILSTQEINRNCALDALLPLFDWESRRIHHMPENVRLNEHFAIFFNRHQLWKVNLSGELMFETQDIDFQITPPIGPKRIKDVRLGCKKNVMVIIIEQSNKEDSIIIWNTVKNIEKENFDITEDYEILWDSVGNPYIQTNSRTIFTRERTSMLCFDSLNITELKARHKNYKQIGMSSGHRFDSHNHHSMIMKEHVSYSFSYLTFVMQSQIEEDGLNPENQFDVTPFNYLINKKTAFLDGEFVRTDVEMLEEILQSLLEKNPLYLSQLQYTRKKKIKKHGMNRSPRQSVLHIAVQTGNNRLIDIILNYLSHNELNCSQFYEDIMYKLICQKKFCAFYSSTLLKSITMREKMIFRISDSYNDLLANINYSKSLYLDQAYFKNVMGDLSEEPEGGKGSILSNSRSIPVDIYALRINWILEDEDDRDNGLNFLYELYDTKVQETYDNQAVQILTEFLIMKYRIWLIPAFWALNFFQMTVFIVSIICDEGRWTNSIAVPKGHIHREGKEIVWPEDNPWTCAPPSEMDLKALLKCIKDHGQADHIPDLKWTIAAQIFGALNLILTLKQLALILVEFSESKTSSNIYHFLTKWRVMESLYIILNAIQTIFQIIGDEEYLYAQRCIAALVVIILFAKGMYYLKLIDKFSRHIEIFFDIMMMIPSFIIILSIFWICFSISFYLIGQNQVQYDQVILSKVPKYFNFWDSIYVVWNIPLGNVDDVAVFWGDDDFAKETGPQSNAIMVILFLMSTFVMLVHLLNMLVAIMGEIFGKESEAMSRIQVAEKLRFIVDKWYYKKYVLRDMDQMKYIIAAFIAQDEKNGDQMMLLELESDFNNHEKDMSKFTDHIYRTLKEAKSHHEQQEKETHSMKLNIKKIHDLVQSLEVKHAKK